MKANNIEYKTEKKDRKGYQEDQKEETGESSHLYTLL